MTRKRYGIYGLGMTEEEAEAHNARLYAEMRARDKARIEWERARREQERREADERYEREAAERRRQGELAWKKRHGLSGLGSERTPGQEKYNEPNMEYRRTREEHDSVEELEAEADKLLFHADSILDEHRGASSLCDNILLSIREAARILGSAEVEAGYASRGALDEHLNSTTEKFIKKCVRKPRG